MKKIGFILLFVLSFGFIYAEKNELPIKEVAIFSSGVAYYEHSGTINKNTTFDFSFSPKQISDVLKSISVYDAGAKKILLKYDCDDTLKKALESLSIDLSIACDLRRLFMNERGAEISVFVAEKISGKPEEKISGKIFGVEEVNSLTNAELVLSLSTDDGIKIIEMENIKGFTFLDSRKNADLKQALDLISKDAGSKQKKLKLELTGETERDVKVAYVMDSAVWKTSYRLELGAKEGIFQAWAIVDNSTNFDWNDVNLKLITGKPISFKQNLFSPYYVKRQELPLSVEGAAEVAVFDSADSIDKSPAYKEGFLEESVTSNNYCRSSAKRQEKALVESSNLLNNSRQFSAKASSISSERFVFSPKQPVTIARQKSIMLPLKVASIPIKKIAVFSDILQYSKVNPKLCIEIKNTTGFKLPAGPITIFDNGYAGDALVEFLPEDETRLIAYGDDLLLQAQNTNKSIYTIETVKIHSGMMEVESSLVFKTNYSIKNNHKTDRDILIEHPIRKDYELHETENPVEKTAEIYRFRKQIPAKKTVNFEINEKKIIRSSYTIADFSKVEILNYSTNEEMPKTVQNIFKTILSEKRKVKEIGVKLDKIEKEKKELYLEQERTRKNMEALQNSKHSDSFLQKLLTIEEKLEDLTVKTKMTKKDLEQAEKKYKEFIENIAL